MRHRFVSVAMSLVLAGAAPFRRLANLFSPILGCFTAVFGVFASFTSATRWLRWCSLGVVLAFGFATDSLGQTTASGYLAGRVPQTINDFG